MDRERRTRLCVAVSLRAIEADKPGPTPRITAIRGIGVFRSVVSVRKETK